MFDDLILLAKGGLTAYHGAVREVEDYFANLGIIVPDHINPPDYFIDVLEGMVKPPSVTYEELPLRWMLHNGYPVPRDMQRAISAAGVPAMQENPTTEQQLSFWGELWQNLKYRVEARFDVARSTFVKSNDLSRRITPRILVQYRYFVGR